MLSLITILKYLSFDALRIENTFTLAVQWLGLALSNCDPSGSVPGQGPKKIKKKELKAHLEDC